MNINILNVWKAASKNILVKSLS